MLAPVRRTCVVYGKPLEWPYSVRALVCGGTSPRLYSTDDGGLIWLSSECALKYRAQRARERRRAARGTRMCPCGREFAPVRSDGVYCSPACKQRAYRQRYGSCDVRW